MPSARAPHANAASTPSTKTSFFMILLHDGTIGLRHPSEQLISQVQPSLESSYYLKTKLLHQHETAIKAQASSPACLNVKLLTLFRMFRESAAQSKAPLTRTLIPEK